MESIIIIILLGIILIYTFTHLHAHYHTKKEDEKFWKDWDKNKRNFPFIYRGRTLWHSRSCATTLITFGYDKNNNLYVLATKRGKGCPDYNGYWNCQSGYSIYNASGEENCVKETKEETGIDIDVKDITFVGVSTSPKENKQNITLRYMTILPKPIEEYTFDLSNMEEDEVEEVKFIPIEEIDNYQWAFSHKDLINTYKPINKS